MNIKRNVYIMYIIVFLQGFVFYGPVATLFRQARGISMSQIFIIESISWALIIALEVPWGYVADRFGYKKTLIIVNTLFFISKVVFFFAHSFQTFLLERIMVSIVISGLSGCDVALIYNSIDKESSKKVFGLFHVVGTVGFLAASVISGFIIRVSLDLTAFYTIFPYGLAVIFTLFLVEVKEQNDEKSSPFKMIKETLKDRNMLIFVLSMSIIMEVVQVVTVFLNQTQYLRSGIDPMYFGVIILLVQAGGLLSSRSSSISDRLGEVNSISILTAGIGISTLILVITNNPFVSIISVFTIATSAAVISPIEMDIKNRSISGSDRATYLSIYSMMGGLVASIANIIIGFVADISNIYALVVCTGFCVIALILVKMYDAGAVNGRDICQE